MVRPSSSRVDHPRAESSKTKQPVIDIREWKEEQAVAVASEERKRLEVFFRGAAALSITTPEEYTLASERLKEVQRRRKDLEEKQDGILRPLLEAERRVRGLFRPPLELCSRIRGVIEGAMRDFRAEQERKRREEEERLQALARKEQERLQRRADRRAEKELAKGNEDAAAEILNSIPELALPVLAQPEIPKVAGVKLRQAWKFRVTNPKQQAELLVKVVARYNAGRGEDDPPLIPGEWWSIDEKAIGQYVRAAKQAATIPGVEVYSEDATAVEA